MPSDGRSTVFAPKREGGRGVHNHEDLQTTHRSNDAHRTETRSSVAKIADTGSGGKSEPPKVELPPGAQPEDD
jgi:hypothetical protein